MQFKTKLGLVDIPNDEVLLAARDIEGGEDLLTVCVARDLIAKLKEENKFLHDLMDGFEWQRINAMSQEEVRRELLAEGYTPERLDAGFAKVRAMIDAAAKLSPNVKDEPRARLARAMRQHGS